MTSDKKTRRRYSAAQKAQVLAECDEPGASVAKVAMAHGINANVVHRWRQLCPARDSCESRQGRRVRGALACGACGARCDGN